MSKFSSADALDISSSVHASSNTLTDIKIANGLYLKNSTYTRNDYEEKYWRAYHKIFTAHELKAIKIPQIYKVYESSVYNHLKESDELFTKMSIDPDLFVKQLNQNKKDGGDIFKKIKNGSKKNGHERSPITGIPLKYLVFSFCNPHKGNSQFNFREVKMNYTHKDGKTRYYLECIEVARWVRTIKKGGFDYNFK